MAQDPMAMDQSFEAGAPADSMGMATQPAPTPAPTPASGKKLVDIYTAMLFIAAIFLLIGSLALAWEKQRYGDDLFGNSWKTPTSGGRAEVIQRHDDFDSLKTFQA